MNWNKVFTYNMYHKNEANMKNIVKINKLCKNNPLYFSNSSIGIIEYIKRYYL